MSDPPHNPTVQFEARRNGAAIELWLNGVCQFRLFAQADTRVESSVLVETPRDNTSLLAVRKTTRQVVLLRQGASGKETAP